MKLKKKIQQMHEKKPYIEPVFLFVMSSLFGFMSSICVGLYTSDQSKSIFTNLYFWISVAILTIISLYYIFFSTYSYKYKNQKSEAKEELLSAYLTLAKKDMKQRDVDSFDKSTYIFQNAMDQLTSVKESEKRDERY